jgi:hypothetical protein
MPHLTSSQLLSAMQKIELNSMRRYIVTQDLSQENLERYLLHVQNEFSDTLTCPMSNEDLVRLAEFIELRLPDKSLQPFPMATVEILEDKIKRNEALLSEPKEAENAELGSASPPPQTLLRPPLPLQLQTYSISKLNPEKKIDRPKRANVLLFDESKLDGHIATSIKGYIKRHELDKDTQLIICTPSNCHKTLARLQAMRIPVKLRLVSHFAIGSDDFAGFGGEGETQDAIHDDIAANIAFFINAFDNIEKVVLAGCRTARLDKKHHICKAAYTGSAEDHIKFHMITRETKKALYLVDTSERQRYGHAKKLSFFSTALPEKLTGLVRRVVDKIQAKERVLEIDAIPEVYTNTENGKVKLTARFPEQKQMLIKSVKIIVPAAPKESVDEASASTDLAPKQCC